MTQELSRPVAQTHGTPRSPRQLWVLWRYWMVREFKTRYAGSVLGLAWAFVQPVASLAIFYVLFGLVLAAVAVQFMINGLQRVWAAWHQP